MAMPGDPASVVVGTFGRPAHAINLHAIVADIRHGIGCLITQHINPPGHKLGDCGGGAAKHHGGGLGAGRLLHQ
jgi:hypothetical protein